MSANAAEAPEVLYHYTTLAGIIGIAEQKQLWATSVRHLADATEFSYAHELLADALRQAAATQSADIVTAVEVLLYHLEYSDRRRAHGANSYGFGERSFQKTIAARS